MRSLKRWKRKERREREKARKNVHMFEELLKLAGGEREPKEKKLQIPKPDTFDGSLDAKPSYKDWFETMNDYLQHNKGTWDDDEGLIRVIGAFLKGKARSWYNKRARHLRDNRKADSLSAFLSVMDERLKADYERTPTTISSSRSSTRGTFSSISTISRP